MSRNYEILERKDIGFKDGKTKFFVRISCANEENLPVPPDNWAMGSTAVATATAVSYVLNASGKWVQRKNGSSGSDETDIRENEYYCDSIVNLPTDTENYAVGTIFLCINECSLYILNSKKEWRDTDGKKYQTFWKKKALSL